MGCFDGFDLQNIFEISSFFGGKVPWGKVFSWILKSHSWVWLKADNWNEWMEFCSTRYDHWSLTRIVQKTWTHRSKSFSIFRSSWNSHSQAGSANRMQLCRYWLFLTFALLLSFRLQLLNSKHPNFQPCDIFTNSSNSNNSDFLVYFCVLSTM